MKVNDYIRCGSAGIRQILEIPPPITGTQYIVDSKGLLIRKYFIKESNADLTKLIKEGDYINEQLVVMIKEDKEGKKHFYSSYWYSDEIGLPIKNVVTKEQFNRDKFHIRQEVPENDD